MFENGTFAVLGPDGKQVQCDVLFTYDCEDNGRSYVVFLSLIHISEPTRP